MRPSLIDFVARRGDYHLAVLLIVLDVIFWGFSFISTKVVLAEIPPVSIAFFRQLIASITLFLLVSYNATPVKIERRDMGYIVAASFFGIVMYFVLENTGLQFTTASNASMIVASLPIFTLFAEAMLFKLKVTWKMVFCLVLSVVGVAMVVTVDGRLDASSARLYGNLLVMGAIICWVIYTILNRRLADKYQSLALTTCQSAVSIILYVPFVVPEIDVWPELSGISMTAIAHLLFLGVFCSGLAYVFYIYAAKRLGATITSTFLNLIPAVTVVSGYVLLNEMLTGIQILGMGIILIALYFLNKQVRHA